MDRFKKAAEKCFVKPYWLTVLIAVPGYLSVVFVLTNGLERSAYGAAAYALSSYALILSGTAVYRMAQAVRERIVSHPLWERVRRDFVFRTKIVLLPNTMITMLFVMMKLLAGFFYHSGWMIALGFYYLWLLLLRLSLLRRVYQNAIDIEQQEGVRASRRYGLYLLLLDIAFAGIVLYSLCRGAEYAYPGYLIYGMAAYSFYAVIMAVVGYIKNRQKENPVIVTLNMVRLTTAMTALFALETAMLTVFGEESSLMFRQSMIAATGSVIAVIILGMALYLIVHFQLEADRKSKSIRRKTSLQNGERQQ